MITKEEREKIAVRIAAHITTPQNEGRIGGLPGLVTAPQIWYIDRGDHQTARAATVVGFWGDDPVCISASHPFRVPNHEAFVSYEEALCLSAERQKTAVNDTQAAYLATCNAALRFLTEKREAKRAEKPPEVERKRPYPKLD